MEPEEYLNKILEQQTIGDDSEEMKQLQANREEVEKVLRKAFEGSNPTIRYGGSKSKNTMIRESYDLDIICYFEHDDNNAGETLEEIYNNVKAALEDKYYVEPKTSALRLKSKDGQENIDFHIDVVPGRFIDDSKTDCFIYQSGGEKERLQTNLDVHIKTIRDSGLTDVVQLVKLWKIRVGLDLKTFVLELLVVKYAKKYQSDPLSKGLISFWEYLRDNQDLSVEDPANSGNDLSSMFNQGAKQLLRTYASNALQLVDSENWEGVFGPAESMPGSEKVEAIKSVISGYSDPPKPWSV